MTELTEEQVGWPIEGLNLRAEALGAELGKERTLLVFLRHLG